MTVTVPPLAPVVAEVEVVHVQRLCPSFVRVTFDGAALADFGVRGPLLDQRIKLVLPAPGAPPPAVDLEHPDGWYAAWLALPEAERGSMRTYTVRALHGSGVGTRLVVDIVVHAHGTLGPGCRWALTAARGDRVLLVGPRMGTDFGGIEFDPGRAGRLLLVGDETAVPAIASILESLPAGTSGRAYLEVPTSDDLLDLRPPRGMRVVWLPRNGVEHGEPTLGSVSALFGLTGASPYDEVGELDDLWETPESSPEEGLYAWVAGESGMVARVRRLLVTQVGLPRRQVAFMGYWRQGVAMRG
jgi:NADPH-dependent ferric siderophore reductase